MNSSVISQKIEDNIKQEILRILHKENEPPEKYTILGSDINEIKHIFYYLKSNKIPIRIDYLIDSYSGYVSDVLDLYVKIHVLGFEESSFRRCRISFNFLNTYYEFEVGIYKVEKESLFLYLPLKIQYISKRKYPRFFPENLYANINILFNNLFSQKEYEQILLQNYPKIIEEFHQDLPNLSIILRIIMQEIMKISTNYTIHIIKKDKIKTEGWHVKQMLTIKKTIYIGNTDDLTSYYYPLNSTLLTNFERLHKNMLKTQSNEDVIKFFESIQNQDLKDQKNSYILSPFFCFDDIIGYFYLETSYIERKRIFLDDAIKVAILSKVLSYTLNRIIFFESYYKESRAIVKNISLSGILIQINSKTIYNYLIDNDLLKIELEIMNQLLKFEGIITRMFTISNNEYNIAIEFYNYIDDSFKFLENYIFNLQTKNTKKGAVAPVATEFRE